MRALGRPLISTTAQHDDGDPFVDPAELDEAFPGLALVIDAGGGGLVPTSIIDLTQSPPEVLREGAGPVDDFVGPARSLRF